MRLLFLSLWSVATVFLSGCSAPLAKHDASYYADVNNAPVNQRNPVRYPSADPPGVTSVMPSFNPPKSYRI